MLLKRLEAERGAIPIFEGERKMMNEENWPFVATELKARAELFIERHKVYGDNYKHFGFVLAHLFPKGTQLDANDADQMNRLGVLVQIVSKLTRYAQNFHKGGHDDSLDDLVVYAMMLKQLDIEERHRRRWDKEGDRHK